MSRQCVSVHPYYAYHAYLVTGFKPPRMSSALWHAIGATAEILHEFLGKTGGHSSTNLLNRRLARNRPCSLAASDDQSRIPRCVGIACVSHSSHLKFSFCQRLIKIPLQMRVIYPIVDASFSFISYRGSELLRRDVLPSYPITSVPTPHNVPYLITRLFSFC